MVTPAAYTPDEDLVAVIAAAVPSLTAGVNLFAGPVEGFDLGAGEIPDGAVFVTATSGLPARQLKDGLTSERRPIVRIRVRSAGPAVSTAFPDGQTLARDVFQAIHHEPPVGYCDSEALNSHPGYIGRDDDGHHEWLITVQLIVDVVG